MLSLSFSRKPFHEVQSHSNDRKMNNNLWEKEKLTSRINRNLGSFNFWD